MNRVLSITAAMSVFGLLALAACSGQAADDGDDDATLGDEQEIKKAEGQKCGGFAGITCPAGSNCKLKGNFPDAPGTCQKPKAGEIGASCGGTSNLQCKSGLVCKLLTSSGPPPGAVGLPAPAPTSNGPPPGAVGLPAPRKGTCQESTSAPRPGEEGGICGGIAGFACDPGLSCVMTGPSHPDQAGKCTKSSGPPPGAVGLPRPNP